LDGSGCKFFVDSHGTIWAGTDHGVFRYIGSFFVRFTIPNPELVGVSFKVEAGKVWSLVEDRKENIWSARDGFGACKFDGKSFTHFTKKDGLCSNNVSSIVEDKAGNVWVGATGVGVYRYDGKGFTLFDATDRKNWTRDFGVQAVEQDRNGRL